MAHIITSFSEINSYHQNNAFLAKKSSKQRVQVCISAQVPILKSKEETPLFVLPRSALSLSHHQQFLFPRKPRFPTEQDLNKKDTYR